MGVGLLKDRPTAGGGLKDLPSLLVGGLKDPSLGTLGELKDLPAPSDGLLNCLLSEGVLEVWGLKDLPSVTGDL